MKKRFLSILIGLTLMVPLFSATISVERKRAAKYDLTPVKKIAFMPVVISGDYPSDQLKIGDAFFNAFKPYADADGKFTVGEMGEDGVDVLFKLELIDFRVSDNGVTIESGDEVVTDEWQRVVHCKFQLSAVRKSDGSVIGTLATEFMDKNEGKKAMLAAPADIMKKHAEEFAVACSLDFFDCQMFEPMAIMDSKTKDKAIKEKMKETQKILKKKNYDTALNTYKEIYESTDDFAAGFNYATVLRALKNFDEAEALYTKLSGIDPKNKTVKKALTDLAKDKANVETYESRLAKNK